jgi:hypothetical protein
VSVLNTPDRAAFRRVGGNLAESPRPCPTTTLFRRAPKPPCPIQLRESGVTRIFNCGINSSPCYFISAKVQLRTIVVRTFGGGHPISFQSALTRSLAPTMVGGEQLNRESAYPCF